MNSHPEPERYSNQNLRRRSFRGENLKGMDFSGADLRGCDFSYCHLDGANFARTRMGKTPQDTIIITIVSLMTAIAAFHAISQMLFGVIDRVPSDPIWNYTLSLIMSLAIASLSTVARHWSEYRRVATILSGAASAALLGFYYGGIIANKDPTIAAATAGIAAILAAGLGYFGSGLIIVAIAIAGCVATYGLTYFVGWWAIYHLSVQSWFGGISLAILTLILMAIALVTLQLASQEISLFGITSFRGADLTNANFQEANLDRTNTNGATGWER